MFSKFGKTLSLVVAGIAATSQSAFAVTVDNTAALSDVGAAATAIVAVLVIIWAARRVFGFLGR